MRFSASEKLEIIKLVEESDVSVKRTLDSLGVPRSSFYRWYQRYLRYGAAGLENRKPKNRRYWNRIPDEERQIVVDVALERPDLSSRELA